MGKLTQMVGAKKVKGTPDGSSEAIEPPLKMEIRQEIPTQDTGARLQCTYAVGKKGTTEDRPVESFGGKGE